MPAGIWPLVALMGLALAPGAPTAPRKQPSPALKALAPTVLEGTVKGPKGESLGDALVIVRPASDPNSTLVRTARTDAAGTFRVELHGAPPFTLLVEAGGFAARTLDNVRGDRPVVVTLGSGGAIDGVVREASGAPVAGARVEARSGVIARELAAWELEVGVVATTTDAKGRFHLEGLTGGGYRLTATARGVGRGERASVRVGTRTELVLLPGSSIVGRVRSIEGAPLADAVVCVEQESNRRFTPLLTKTDSAGRFEFVGLEPGHYNVLARRDDFAPAALRDIALAHQSEASVDLVLTPGATVQGRLIDASRKPLRGRVALDELDSSSMPYVRPSLWVAETGPDGRFTLPRVPAGPHVLKAHAPGLLPTRLEFDLEPRDSLENIGDVLLEAGFTIRGRVVDKAGAGIAGARFRASQADTRTVVNEVSRDGGSFVVGVPLPGMYDLWAAASGYGMAQLSVEAGGEPIDVVLETGGVITGVVVDEAGAPVKAYRVFATTLDRHEPNDPSFEPVTVTAEDGRFTVEDLERGRYVVSIDAADYTHGFASDVDVEAGRTSDVGTIRLEAGCSVRGMVVSSDGSPLGGATVVINGPHTSESRDVTDAAGTFDVRGVTPGTVSAGATHPDYAPGYVSEIRVEPSKSPAETRIVLSPGGRLEGWARERDGSATRDVIVYLTAFGFEFRVPQDALFPSSSDGSFFAEHLPPGPLSVTLASRSTRMVVGREDVQIVEGRTSHVQFLSRRILVSGRVTRSGQPVAQCRVSLGNAELEPRNPSPDGIRFGSALTNEEGGYELLATSPGLETMSLAAPGRPILQRAVEIPDADTLVLDVELGGVDIHGIVVDARTEQPIARAHLTVASEKRSYRRGTTSNDGRFSIEVEPGEAKITITADGYLAREVALKVGTENSSELRIGLEHGRVLKGRLVDSEGRGVGGVPVSAVAGETASGSAQTEQDGSFTLESLPNRRYVLFAGSEAIGFGLVPNVAPGDPEVVVQLRAPARLQLHVSGSDGTPAPGSFAVVTSIDSVAFGYFSPRMQLSDANGDLEIVVPPGTLGLIVGGSRGSATASAVVPEGGTVEMDVRLGTNPEGVP